MIQILSRAPCRVTLSQLHARQRFSAAISALSVSNRHKSTNQSKKSQNLQQAALRLEKTLPCPPRGQSTVLSKTQNTILSSPNLKNPPLSSSSSSSSSSSPPPQSDLTKWLLFGGVLAAGAGFGLYTYLSSDEADSGSQKSSKTEAKSDSKFRSPATSTDIPKHVPYLLIGGGTASFAAFRAIKSNEPGARVMVISNESVMPYMRPPLSKEIWFDAQLGVDESRFKQWNGADRSLFYEPEEFYMPAEKLIEAQYGGVSVIRGYSVEKLIVGEQKVVLDNGSTITYDKCLIATGSTPKTIEVFDSAPAKVRERIHTFKSIKDFETVKGAVEKSKSVAIVGNGFLGSELACALSHYGKDGKLKVIQLFNENGNMAKILPEYLSKWVTERIKDVGVDVHPNSQIVGVELFEGNQLKLILSNGKSIIVDQVIQAVGSAPNVKLAKSAGLEIDSQTGGFVVNAELEARSNLYAAGDAASFYDPKLGRRRVEHHDHAVVSGRLAGENMVGLKKPYKHQSMFWSDLGSAVGYEAIGLVDSSLKTVAVFAKYNPLEEIEERQVSPLDTEGGSPVESEKAPEPKPTVAATAIKAGDDKENENFGKGVIFYMKGEQIVGILLWNVFNRIAIARKVLMSDETFKDLNEVAKLFDIFDQQREEKDD